MAARALWPGGPVFRRTALVLNFTGAGFDLMRSHASGQGRGGIFGGLDASESTADDSRRLEEDRRPLSQAR
jgi:hypothetical protein